MRVTVYMDTRSATDKTPWRVLVRFGATLSRIDVHRFASEHAARTFAASLA
jgi:hypothetical protein